MTAVTQTVLESVQQFRLPDVGEGLEEATIVSWRVGVGARVTHNQVLVEIETAKSLVELPSPFDGVVTELLAAEGETVKVGTPIISVGPEAAPPASQPEPTPSVLVGYGPAGDGGRRRRRRRPTASPAHPGLDGRVRAKPPVRKLARDLGVDLATVPATGPHGTITREDVERAAAPAPVEAPALVGAPEPDVTRIPASGVRKATAAAMVKSAFTAPHVTEFLTVDVTRSVKLVEELRAAPAYAGSKVTMLLLAARALIAAAKEFPDVNASWDDTAGEIVRHERVNLGIAAATPRGLVVPSVKDAGSLTLPQLAAAITELVQTAREGRAAPRDLTGGTITLTNIGVFGVDAGTPILNPGEAAILCLGQVRRTPWEHKGRIALRWTTQLALSFDHRLVDGELGSRVLARVGAILERPKWELMQL